MLPAIMTADQMLKAADVELISYENVGSTTILVIDRDVAACVCFITLRKLQQQVK